MRKKILRPIKIGLLLSAFVAIGLLLLILGIHPFLSPTKKAGEARILVVEGWIPDYALQAAVHEFNTGNYTHLITTGGPLGPAYRVFIGGKLHFNIPDSLKQQTQRQSVLIEAYGSQVKGTFAHFSVWINDSIYLGETFTSSQHKKYEFAVDTSFGPVQSVHIYFDNDKMTSTQDRDLFIRTVTVNGKKIKYNFGGLLYEQHYPDSVRKIQIHPTYAENAAAELIRMGIDRNWIISVSAPEATEHKTFHSAIALRKYLIQHNITSFNLLSVGVHTRRSWLTYEKALGKDFFVGIVSVENKTYRPGQWWQQKQVFKSVMLELAKYLYVRLWYDEPSQISPA